MHTHLSRADNAIAFHISMLPATKLSFPSPTCYRVHHRLQLPPLHTSPSAVSLVYPHAIRIPLSACLRFGRWPSIGWHMLRVTSFAHGTCGAEHVPDFCSFNCCPSCEPLFLQRFTSRARCFCLYRRDYILLVDWILCVPANLTMQGTLAETRAGKGLRVFYVMPSATTLALRARPWANTPSQSRDLAAPGAIFRSRRCHALPQAQSVYDVAHRDHLSDSPHRRVVV